MLDVVIGSRAKFLIDAIAASNFLEGLMALRGVEPATEKPPFSPR